MSPDGRTLLFLREHRHLMTMPIEGGAVRPLARFAPDFNPLVEFPAWTPDGRGVVFSITNKRGDLFALQGAGLTESR